MLGHSTYSDEDIRRLSETLATTIDETQRRRLEAIATQYRLDKASPQRWAPSKLIARLKRINTHASRLLCALGVTDAADAPDGPGDLPILEALASVDEGGEDAIVRATARMGRLIELMEIVDSVSRLSETAEAAEQDKRAHGNLVVPRGHGGDWAVNEWIAATLGFYEAITGRRPGTSVGAPGRKNVGKAEGPLIRFLDAAAAPLDIKISSNAWRQRIRSILQQT